MQLQDAQANYSSANTTITTTTETVAVTSPLTRVYRNSAIVLLAAWAHVTLGTSGGTPTVTPRIRRGTAITDTLVNEANAEECTASQTKQFSVICFEQLTAEQVVQYSLTVQQATVTGNGTILEAGIVVLVV